MSANLYWEQVKRKKHDLNVGAPSSFMETLEKAFGSKTPVLNQGSRGKLEGMAAATRGDFANAYQALRDALDEYEEVEVTAEY